MLFSRLSKIYTKKGVFGALLPRISAKNAIFVQLLRIEYEHRQPRYSKTTDSRKGKRAGGVQGTTGQLERGMETLCAFLNSEGGTVLFGVTDKGKIIGQEVSDKTKRDIAEAIRRFEPFATLEVSYISIQNTDKSVIALSADSQRYMRPFSYKGRAYLRLESVTSSMPQDVYNQLLMQ